MVSSSWTWTSRFHDGFLSAEEVDFGVEDAEGGSATAVAVGAGGCWVLLVESARKHEVRTKGAAMA